MYNVDQVYGCSVTRYLLQVTPESSKTCLTPFPPPSLSVPLVSAHSQITVYVCYPSIQYTTQHINLCAVSSDSEPTLSRKNI